MRKKVDRQLALDVLEKLSEDTEWPGIFKALRRGWASSASSQIFDRAVSVFKDEEIAIEWLTSPLLILDGHCPMEFDSTPERREKIINILSRIEHGNYS
jgi:hypothetical protein